jgi:hypothetical protein
MPQYDYNFDPHASAPENWILGEEHPTAVTGQRRVLVPKFAPFFFKDLVVRLGSEELIEGRDYYLCIAYREASHRFGQLVFGGIWLIDDKRAGTFRIDYRTVGDKYTLPRSRITQYLTNELTDPQQADWIDVMGQPMFIPPVEIKFDRPAYYDEQVLSASIRTLADGISAKDPKEDELYQFLDRWLRELERVVHTSPMIAHLTNKNNPHGTKWFHADALKVDGVAANSAKAYGKTLAELTAYVNARGITQAHLDAYIKLRGGKTVTGDLRLRDGAMLIEGMKNGAGVVLSLDCGNAAVDSKKGVAVTADKNANQPGKRVKLQAGTNVLEVISSGGVQEKDNLRLNGHPVVHEGNLTDHIPSVGTYIVDLRTADTLVLKFSGLGTVASPLKIEAMIPQSGLGLPGIATVTSQSGTQTDRAISEHAVKLTNDEFTNKVPKTRTINGQPLSSDVTLTADSIGLGNVVNVPDTGLPANPNHTLLLENKAPAVHEHGIEDFAVPTATTTVKGVARVTEDLSAPNNTDVADSIKVAEIADRANFAVSQIFTRLPKNLIDVSHFGGYGTSPIAVNKNGWKLTFTQTQPYYTGQVQYTLPITELDLAVLFPTTRFNTAFYIYVEVVGGSARYVLRGDFVVDSAAMLRIGKLTTNSTGIVTVEVLRRCRLGQFRELTDHIEARSAHGFDAESVTPQDVGLGLVENKPLLESLVIPSFREVFDTWYRFSHRSDGVYPSLPAETTTWEYLPATDSIRNLTNSSSCVGMVSNSLVGDYEFECAVSSTNADDDHIGIVLGFAIIDGVEHTLIAYATGTDTRDYSFFVAYNYTQSLHGGRVLWQFNQPLRKGWDELGECTIRAVKVGNRIDLEFSPFSGASESVGATYTVELTGDLEKFRGSTRFGYTAQSQAYSTWRNIKRPDESVGNYYADGKLLAQNYSWGVRTTVISGKLAVNNVNGTYSIPLPRVVDPASYHVWLGHTKIQDTNGGLKTGTLTFTKYNNRVEVTEDTGWSINQIAYVITIFNDVRMYTNN